MNLICLKSTSNAKNFNFFSRSCRNSNHVNCCGTWSGLGLYVLCNCLCHRKKELETSFRGNSNSSHQSPLNASQNKPLSTILRYYDSLYGNVNKQAETYFEDYMRYNPSSQCGKDHRFKPSFHDLQTSIDHASELVALFFNEGLKYG